MRLDTKAGLVELVVQVDGQFKLVQRPVAHFRRRPLSASITHPPRPAQRPAQRLDPATRFNQVQPC